MKFLELIESDRNLPSAQKLIRLTYLCLTFRYHRSLASSKLPVYHIMSDATPSLAHSETESRSWWCTPNSDSSLRCDSLSEYSSDRVQEPDLLGWSYNIEPSLDNGSSGLDLSRHSVKTRPIHFLTSCPCLLSSRNGLASVLSLKTSLSTTGLSKFRRSLVF